MKFECHRVNYLSNNQSTDNIRAMSPEGSPIVFNTMTIVTRPACGIPAAPILARVAVMLIVMYSTTPRDMPLY